MTSIPEIIRELRADNGSNYKMDVLRKHKDNKLLQRVLKMTYDKVDYTYGISVATIDEGCIERRAEGMYDQIPLFFALDTTLEKLASRELTGNAAREKIEQVMLSMWSEEARVLYGILNRDLRINMGRSNINKVFKNLIVKPVYMRCGLFNEKTKSKINPRGAIVQLKADGTYRQATVENGEVSFISRSGEQYEYPRLSEIMVDFPDGHYIGELTVWRDGTLLGRAEGNGLINSDNPPHEDIIFELWDYVTLEEYTGAANKVKGTTPYHERYAQVMEITSAVEPINDVLHVRPILSYEVNSFAEALQRCADWMTAGYEGAILKDRDAIFRDGTSPQQLKLKLEIDVDVRITGFKEGTPGSRRAATFGAMTFETDDGMIRGRTSGFTDAQLADFNNRREELIGQIMTVTCNDITRGRDNDYYALSHPRFIELRSDKTETDTLERALETKEMAMDVGEK